jgi:thiamine-phosphate pyrophosphorylase
VTDHPRLAMEQLDLRLYAILDPEHAGGHRLPDLARAVAAGGATIVQLRDKVSDMATTVQTARAIKAALPDDVPLIINDRVDVALAAEADGVHLGPEDMSVLEARRLLGPGPFIGLSVKSVAQAWGVPLGPVDYVGIGGVFGTTSKNNPNPPIGVEGLRSIVRVFHDRIGNFPTCGIAGINAHNAAAVIAAGADGVAVISALSHQPDPAEAARTLRAIVDAELLQHAPFPPATAPAHH